MEPALTILIPAKHEEHTVIKTLSLLARYVKTPHRTIVVNISDQSDATANIVNTYIRTHPKVQLIRSIHPKGTFGMAMAAGIKAVRTGVLVPVMADMCDDPRDIDRMYRLARKGWDVVCASRYTKGGKKIGGPWAQSVFSYIVCTAIRFLTRVPTTDVSNAFKMYNATVLKKIQIPQTSGVEVSMEITLRLYFDGATITEIPTTWKGRTAGQSKFKLIERMPKYVRIFLWALGKSIHRGLSL